MSELENRLDKKRRDYRDLLAKSADFKTRLGHGAAEVNLRVLADEILKYEMYISDADRLARGEEISLVVYGTWETWVENGEELWNLVFDHALQVKDELKEAEKEAELDELLATSV